MTKIKICGITRQEDAALAADLGADFLGFIFVKSSPRYIEPEGARVVESSSRRVGVFRNESAEEIARIAEIARLDFVQLHGTQAFGGLPVIRALHVKDSLPPIDNDADYILFDTGGGTGRTFDWSLVANYPRTKPFFLAGGITPENVEEAIAATQPFAIDVASGVERAPGIKDPDKLKRLFERIAR